MPAVRWVKDGGTGFVEVLFRVCRVHIWPDAQYLVTTFKDGSTVPAAPEFTDEYRTRAFETGYTGPDGCWQMCMEHELFHSLLAERLQASASAVLWAVAHGREPNPAERDLEEWRVMSLQMWLYAGQVTEAIRLMPDADRLRRAVELLIDEIKLAVKAGAKA